MRARAHAAAARASAARRGASASSTLCDLFVVESGRRFRASRIALQSAQDETRRLVARHVREAGGYGVVNTLLHTEISDGLADEASSDPATTEVTR